MIGEVDGDGEGDGEGYESSSRQHDQWDSLYL
jgi:hypothetical protein